MPGLGRHYPFSTLGVYNEAIMLVQDWFEGEPYTFCPFIYVDNDTTLACGVSCRNSRRAREIGYTRPPPTSHAASG